jgi:hypothetical protein
VDGGANIFSSQRRSGAAAPHVAGDSGATHETVLDFVDRAVLNYPLKPRRHIQLECPNSFQFFFHTVEIKDRRIFHDISVYASHVKTGVIFGVMPSKKNNSLVTPDLNHDS